MTFGFLQFESIFRGDAEGGEEERIDVRRLLNLLCQVGGAMP